ncbi:MAG TPA: DNA polymerase III subunit delta' [Rhodocyclaceae bacterium]|nr:DNA polymerase III subunit delta' [Rhodocyclaceae bacterium]HNA03961.1 DNA polymerase III subunit delta' [Rhodocyclaceae bacterium]HNB78162.1 DNA polymerase III subunit delta' [Rhodocyclaceae bacterium]HNC60257.1 DNA polymerase III subunit delta' [Rhodocyclaceae bacterium]HNH11957.1 DNA polymerase III subunit delta' [Rhodocyclaceae bacterium]
MIFEWQQAAWQGLLGRLGQLPHAILLGGQPGSGKSEFALALAQRLLCEAAQGAAEACGECDGCRWFLGANHPDYRLVAPGSDDFEAEANEGDEAAEPGKPATQIRTEQVRALADFVTVGAVRQGVRVVVIDPAEAMNHHTANALLKLLEEPPARVQFILVSDAPRRLLPTILSRCRQLALPRPDATQAARWLAAEGVVEAERLLAVCGGMPVAARDLAGGIGADAHARFVRDLLSLERADPVALAGAWESWLKTKDAVGAGFGVPQLVDWLQRWVADLILVTQAGRVRFYPEQQKALTALAAKAPLPALLACYNELQRLRRVAAHPLNLRLLLDDMLLRYARLVAR